MSCSTQILGSLDSWRAARATSLMQGRAPRTTLRLRCVKKGLCALANARQGTSYYILLVLYCPEVCVCVHWQMPGRAPPTILCWLYIALRCVCALANARQGTCAILCWYYIALRCVCVCIGKCQAGRLYCLCWYYIALRCVCVCIGKCQAGHLYSIV